MMPDYEHARWFLEVGGKINLFLQGEVAPGGPVIDPPWIIVCCQYEIDGKEFGREVLIDASDPIVTIGNSIDRLIKLLKGKHDETETRRSS